MKSKRGRKPTKEECSFQEGDLVGARVKGYPMWPGFIQSIKKCGKKNQYEVRFFGSHDCSKNCVEIKPFQDMTAKELACKHKQFAEALSEARERIGDVDPTKADHIYGDTLKSSPEQTPEPTPESTPEPALEIALEPDLEPGPEPSPKQSPKLSPKLYSKRSSKRSLKPSSKVLSSRSSIPLTRPSTKPTHKPSPKSSPKLSPKSSPKPSPKSEGENVSEHVCIQKIIAKMQVKVDRKQKEKEDRKNALKEMKLHSKISSKLSSLNQILNKECNNLKKILDSDPINMSQWKTFMGKFNKICPYLNDYIGKSLQGENSKTTDSELFIKCRDILIDMVNCTRKTKENDSIPEIMRKDAKKVIKSMKAYKEIKWLVNEFENSDSPKKVLERELNK